MSRERLGNLLVGRKAIGVYAQPVYVTGITHPIKIKAAIEHSHFKIIKNLLPEPRPIGINKWTSHTRNTVPRASMRNLSYLPPR